MKSHKGGRREQSNPLMPMLFALLQHRALAAAQKRLHDNGKLFAFLDVVCTPDRVADVLAILAQ